MSQESLSESRFHRIITAAIKKFKSRPSTYLLIPVIAAFVGWFTNYLAVQMIFYPIEFKGVPIWRKEEVPLGLVGWHGIVPCKTRIMSETMVNMVTSQLLNVKEVFMRLDTHHVAKTLSPEVPKLMQSMVEDKIPLCLGKKSPASLFYSLPGRAVTMISDANQRFLNELALSMQNNIEAVLNVKNCVIDQMMQDRSLLGVLFWKCGEAELNFLTNSGLWFGFMLGLIQMVVALMWENPWSLSIGGTVVGLATNWLALKWIFEPVNPTKIGPFILQGQFLRRQKEVAKEFSKFFSNSVLTSKQLWGSILTDPGTSLSFDVMFLKNFQKFVHFFAGGFGLRLSSTVITNLGLEAVSKLPRHLHVLHPYADKTLKLEGTLRSQMERMTNAKFERVLHPIFEEDELTLILAGGFLGFVAGLIQQGIETGAAKNWVDKRWEWVRTRFGKRIDEQEVNH